LLTSGLKTTHSLGCETEGRDLCLSLTHPGLQVSSLQVDLHNEHIKYHI